MNFDFVFNFFCLLVLTESVKFSLFLEQNNAADEGKQVESAQVPKVGAFLSYSSNNLRNGRDYHRVFP